MPAVLLAGCALAADTPAGTRFVISSLNQPYPEFVAAGAQVPVRVTGPSAAVLEHGVVTLNDIFIFKQSGFTPEGKVIGKHEPTGQIPNFVSKLRKRGIKIDMSMFAPEGGEKSG